MNTRSIITVIAACAALLGVVWLRTPTPPALSPPTQGGAATPLPSAPPPIPPSIPEAAAPSQMTRPAQESAPLAVAPPPREQRPRRTATPEPQAAPPAPQRPAKARENPFAREALKLVGTDRNAEVYWFTAINDPNLSASERSDLIEDLNEEGFEDPDNPSPAELPLIERRLRIIEELAPLAIDRVNFDAFREAHKDLLEMQQRLRGIAP